MHARIFGRPAYLSGSCTKIMHAVRESFSLITPCISKCYLHRKLTNRKVSKDELKKLWIKKYELQAYIDMITSRLGINYYLRLLVIDQKKNFLGGNWKGFAASNCNDFPSLISPFISGRESQNKVSLARITLVNEPDKYGRTTIAV